jgi:hypothetical protein
MLLPCQRRWVSMAWCSGVSITDVAYLDLHKAVAPSGAVVVSMISLMKGFASFLHPKNG